MRLEAYVSTLAFPSIAITPDCDAIPNASQNKPPPLVIILVGLLIKSKKTNVEIKI